MYNCIKICMYAYMPCMCVCVIKIHACVYLYILKGTHQYIFCEEPSENIWKALIKPEQIHERFKPECDMQIRIISKHSSLIVRAHHKTCCICVENCFLTGFDICDLRRNRRVWWSTGWPSCRIRDKIKGRKDREDAYGRCWFFS